MPEWNDELRKKVVNDYEAASPTPENTQEIVKGIAKELGEGFTPNGVMSILVKAQVYLKKTPATGKAKAEGTSKRVNKADAIASLTTSIEALGLVADGDILGKLTGKAAIYFTGVIEKATEED